MRHGIRLKHIKIVTKANRRRYVYYSEPGNKRVPLPDLPENHPEFLRAYTAAQQGAEPVSRGNAKAGTIAALVASYKRSPTWCSLRGSTQQVRARILDKIMVKGGGAMVAGLHPKHIRNDISECLPHAANTRLKVWRTLLEHAVDIGLIERNPARDVRKVDAPTKGHHCWTDEEIALFRAQHPSGTKARLAFELLLWSGARRGDAVLLGRQHISGGSMAYVSRKTGVDVCIPVLADFQAELDQIPQTQMLFLVTFNGKPHSDKAFGAWFGKHCNTAGLPSGCRAHGLRKARARIMAEDGKTAHQIAAWGGWKTLGEVAHYTEAANRRKLTHDGIEQERNTGNAGEPVSNVGENISKINEVI